MSERCDTIREWLPDHAGGRLDAVRAASLADHLDACDTCAREARLASLLYSARPAPPAGLSGRIQLAVRERPQPSFRPWWGLAAAAVAAVALGIGIAVPRSGAPDAGLPAFAAAAEESDFWLSDDGLIAGAPTFEDLSDEALVALLEELEGGGGGGGGGAG